jgi:hypothetical protein
VKIPSCASGVVRGFATSGALAVPVIFFARAPAVQSTASDVSAQSADSHNITGSTAGVTLQPSATRSAAPIAYSRGSRCVRKPDLEQISG